MHIYSKEYLKGDIRFTHYYAFLSLFTGAMLFYVMGATTLQMLVGWELVGVCSFVLIGHWWEEKPNSDAALKAFWTNRVGDVGLLLGVIVLFFAAGQTFNVLDINGYALTPGANQTLLLVGALLLFGGVTSKSGQFPLHTWLPDAMAGPTPVSALIHAATMVVAGVYLIARMYSVFFEGLNIGTNHINYVALIGGVTVLIGAGLAFVQQDIKKVLAYSTISQLGYMVMALGVGAWTAGVFHLFTHAFFKAGLFLGAGSVSHAAHHTFDMRKMGGLKKYMPSTFWTFMICTLALMGVFPLAGFWSKDEILAGAGLGQSQRWRLQGVHGDRPHRRRHDRGVHDQSDLQDLLRRVPRRGHSARVAPHHDVAALDPELRRDRARLPQHPADVPDRRSHRVRHAVRALRRADLRSSPRSTIPSFNWALAGLSTLAAGLGILLALQYYNRERSPLRGLSKHQPFAFGYYALENKYGLDVLYTDYIVGAVKGPIARVSNWINQNVIDAVVNSVGVASRAVAGVVYRDVDQRVVDGIVVGSGLASEEGGQILRHIQTGKVQQYAAILFAAAAILAGVFVFIV